MADSNPKRSILCPIVCVVSVVLVIFVIVGWVPVPCPRSECCETGQVDTRPPDAGARRYDRLSITNFSVTSLGNPTFKISRRGDAPGSDPLTLPAHPTVTSVKRGQTLGRVVGWATPDSQEQVVKVVCTCEYEGQTYTAVVSLDEACGIDEEHYGTSSLQSACFFFGMTEGDTEYKLVGEGVFSNHEVWGDHMDLREP